MAFTSKLCNPTPFKVELPWDRGICIVIEPFGATDLNMQQMDDFRPGKPGSAEVRATLDYYALFLLDSDRAYDNQALEALKRSRKARQTQYDASVKSIREGQAAAGIPPSDEALKESLQKQGVLALGEKIQVLSGAIAKFQEVVSDEPERSLRPKLDPNRTVFVLNPPREFPSVAAMEFFLEQNPEVLSKHRAFLNRGAAAEASSESSVSMQDFVDDVVTSADAQ